MSTNITKRAIRGLQGVFVEDAFEAQYESMTHEAMWLDTVMGYNTNLGKYPRNELQD